MASKLRKIFEDHWDEFVKLYGNKIRKVVFKEVEKMMNCGDKINFIPYERMRKTWQKLLLEAIEQKVCKRKFKNLKNKLYAYYSNGFYVYAKGEVKNEKAATAYVGRYTGRPAIADSRIIKYDGRKVTIYYQRHEDGKG